PAASSSLLLDELFASGDVRFLSELLASSNAKKLAGMSERWYRDKRPFARAMLLRYIDDGCDRPQHRALVKRLFKLAEAARDDEAMGHFLVAFDRLLVRRLQHVTRYDWVSRETVTHPRLMIDPTLPDRMPRNAIGAPRF